MPRRRNRRLPQGTAIHARTCVPNGAASRSCIRRFELAPDIELNTRVHAKPARDGWELALPNRTVFAKHLVAATGVHNDPVIPAVRRSRDEVAEIHSSALRDPGSLKDRSVLVVGAGASALDLLDLAVQHGAASIAWSHRGLRCFAPTRKPKAIAGSVRCGAQPRCAAALLPRRRPRRDRLDLVQLRVALPLDRVAGAVWTSSIWSLTQNADRSTLSGRIRYPADQARVSGRTRGRCGALTIIATPHRVEAFEWRIP
jgi:cation diffusion facilitator CzcD-associated flavoprotein CzcO